MHAICNIKPSGAMSSGSVKSELCKPGALDLTADLLAAATRDAIPAVIVDHDLQIPLV
jgi:hypothetical protein